MSTAHAFQDLPIDTSLYPEEAALVANAVQGRRTEYATTRACARQALARLGYAPVPIPTGPGGAPVWPAGVVGSLTHCKGLRAAAVASREHARSIGIDIERHAALPDYLTDLVTTERERLAFPSGARELPWLSLAFSAKEAAFKAWFPLTQLYLECHNIDVRFTEAGTFIAQICAVTRPPAEIRARGRWAVVGDYAVTAVVIQ